MTLVVAIRCGDGVVVASDSASSDLETNTKQPVEKIRRLGSHAVLYGGSGDVGLLQKIDEELEVFAPKPKLKNTRKELKKIVVTELADSNRLHAPYPQVNYNVPPPAVLLFAGVQNGQPWILEIEKDGRDTFYDDRLGNFGAVGSGKPLAEAIFRPHLRTERDIELGKIFAYRVVEDSIKMSAAGLAEPIHIVTISTNQEVEVVSNAELAKLKDTCGLWRQLERDAVGRLLAGTSGEEDADIPEPEN